MLRDDRDDIPYPDRWDLPGGGREGSETPLRCALRETREELSLEIAPEAVHWGRDFPGTRPGQDRVWFFATRDDGLDLGRVRLGDEGQRWALMPVAEYLAHPRAIAPLVERLRVYLAERGA
nr:NUDIX hydrolase [Frigidibacter sp. ROC022]